MQYFSSNYISIHILIYIFLLLKKSQTHNITEIKFKGNLGALHIRKIIFVGHMSFSICTTIVTPCLYVYVYVYVYYLMNYVQKADYKIKQNKYPNNLKTPAKPGAAL